MLDLHKWFNPKHYNRLWNVGPPGALLTGMMVYTMLRADIIFDFRLIGISDFWLNLLMFLTFLEGIIILFWILFMDANSYIFQKELNAFIRHPVYTVIMFHFPVFYFLLFRSFGGLLIVPVIYLFWTKIIVREEEYLVGIFGQDYVDYMREVPRFIPWR